MNYHVKDFIAAYFLYFNHFT